MKKPILYIAVVLLLLGAGMLIALKTAEQAAYQKITEQTNPEETVLQITAPEETELPVSVPAETGSSATVSAQIPTELPTQPPVILTLTEEEEEILLKLGMAERGDSDCTQCIALVMRTVLNRVDSPKFSSGVRGVVYAQDQFTPVAEGTFESAVPNDRCREALEMVKRGWDESQGALYYEWCEGESWHSRNLNLLFQHCDTRFYN